MPQIENMEDDLDFKELVGDEGNLKGMQSEDILDKETSKVEEPSSEGGTAEDEPEAAPEPEPEPPKVDEAPKKTPYQERIDELTRKRYEAERETQRLREDNERLRGTQPTKTEPPKPAEGQPKSEDFDTYDEYYVALADFRADQKIKQWRDEESKSRQLAFVTQKQAEFRERLKVGESVHADFNEVVFDPSAPISRAMVEICQEIENPADVLYYLAKNHDKARNIAIMTPVQAARAIGKIEVEIASNLKTNPRPTTKLTSSAPPPIRPVATSTPTMQKDPAKMSHEEYRKWRRAGGGK